MNCRSVAEQVCTTAARPLPPTSRTSEPTRKIASASPAAAVKRGFTPPLSALGPVTLHHSNGWASTRDGALRMEECGAAPSVGPRSPRARAPPSARPRTPAPERRPPSGDQTPVRAAALHANRLVDAEGGCVLRPDEEADRRHTLEQKPAEVAHPPLGELAVAHRRVNPHLLDLHGRRRPRRRLGLEQDRPVVDP